MIIDAHLHCTGRERTAEVLAAFDDAGIDIGVGFVDDSLAKSPFICGDRLTPADIGIHWVLHIARMLQLIDFGEFKNCAAYMERIDSRPSVKKAYAIPPDYVREPPGSAVTPARVKRH